MTRLIGVGENIDKKMICLTFGTETASPANTKYIKRGVICWSLWSVKTVSPLANCLRFHGYLTDATRLTWVADVLDKKVT